MSKNQNRADVLAGAINRFIGGMISRVGHKAVFDYEDVLLLQKQARGDGCQDCGHHPNKQVCPDPYCGRSS